MKELQKLVNGNSVVYDKTKILTKNNKMRDREHENMSIQKFLLKQNCDDERTDVNVNLLDEVGVSEDKRGIKRSRSPNHLEVDTKKLKTEKKHSSTSSHPELKHAADLVVKYLTPYYKSGKITSKDLFKALARSLSHKVVNKNGGTSTKTSTDGNISVKEDIKKSIKDFFIRCPVVKTSDDIEDL